MTAISQSKMSENQNQTQEQETQETKKQAAIQKFVSDSKKFNEDTDQNIKIAPNVPLIILFPHDFYLDFDDMIDEQIAVFHRSQSEAAEYAEKNYRVRRKLESDPKKPDRSWGSTTYKGLKLPESNLPDLTREWTVTSKKAI